MAYELGLADAATSAALFKEVKNSGRTFNASLFGYRTDPTSSDWIFVPADVIPRYSVTNSKEYTEFPLENGTIVSDHAIHRPAYYDILINSTNTPILWGVDGFESKELKVLPRKSEFKAGGFLALTQTVMAGIGVVTDALGLTSDPVVKFQTLQGPGTERINKCFESLLTALNNSYNCMLIKDGRAYENIYITSLQRAQEGPAELGNFAMTCKEVVFVTTGESTLKIIDPAEGRNDQKANAGKKAPQQEPELESLSYKFKHRNDP